MEQNALTVLVPIRTSEIGALETLLREIGDDIEDNQHLRFRDTPSTHFARLVILNGDAKRGPRLLFSSNHDGTLESYARELAAQVGVGMESVWEKCQGYSRGTATDPARFEQFLRRYSVGRPQVFYVAYRGMDVGRVSNSLRLRETIDALLDRPEVESWLRVVSGLLPREAQEDTASSPKSTRPDRNAFNPIGVSPLARMLEWLVGIRGGAEPERRMVAHPRLVEVEDRVAQNQMTILSPIKRPRFLRVRMLRLVLLLVGLRARRSQGSLSGLTTIHFARWVIIDGGRNLLFESNFDGSWERYIDDFVDQASVGMNLIWANCVRFPKAGARDIEAFKEVIRSYQYPSQVFYSAYPTATVTNILDALQLGDAVGHFLRQEEVERFLSGAYSFQSPDSLERLFGGKQRRGKAGTVMRFSLFALSAALRVFLDALRGLKGATAEAASRPAAGAGGADEFCREVTRHDRARYA